jgi:hypothetical protein
MTAYWLEDRGYLYYRRKKPEGSPAAMWVGLQQFIEPGVRHETAVKAEQVRLYLAAAQQAGLDWTEMYAEAVRRHLSAHPERATVMPPREDVALAD